MQAQNYVRITKAALDIASELRKEHDENVCIDVSSTTFELEETRKCIKYSEFIEIAQLNLSIETTSVEI